MNKKNNDGFYLAIGMFFVLSICILFGLCGEEIFSEVDMFDKVIGYILKGFCLVIATTLLVWGCKLYFCDFGIIDEWTLASAIDEKKCEKYTAVIFDETVSIGKNYKNLEKAVFYSDNIEIGSKTFINSKKLQQITFYEKPKEITKDAFLRCKNISLIHFYGTKEEWKSYKLFIPSDPKIVFLESPENKTTMNKTKIDLNCNGTINIRNH